MSRTELIKALSDAKKNNMSIGECWNLMDAAADMLEADGVPVAAYDRLHALCESQAKRILALEDTPQPAIQVERVPLTPTREQLLELLALGVQENQRLTEKVAKLEHAIRFKAAVDKVNSELTHGTTDNGVPG